MAVVYYSPLTFLYWYDKPAKYAAGHWPELSWFDHCPVSWDETRVLAGDVGEYIVIARRSGQRWFVGAMTNEAPRTLEVPLSFLGAGQWTAHVYADGTPEATPHATRVEISERPVDRAQSLHLRLAPAGGQAVRIEQRQRAETGPADSAVR
jgi:alpha-glucosidase